MSGAAYLRQIGSSKPRDRMARRRLLGLTVHDDGVNAWRMARYDAAPELAGAFHGYLDYCERTHGFTARRELPHPEAVLTSGNRSRSSPATGGR